MYLTRSVIVAGAFATMLSAAAQAQTPALAPQPVAAAPQIAPPPARPRNPIAFAAHVAATVNDEVITTYDLQQRMLLLIVTSGVQPTEQNAPELQREALRGLVDERLQLQEIHRIQTKQKMKIEPSDKEIDDELTDLARGNNMKLECLARQLASAGVSINTLKDQLRAQIAWRRYMGGRFGGGIRIGDDQVRAQQARISAASAKPQYLVSEIYLDAQRVGGMNVAANGAKTLIEQLQKGAPFAAVARQFSASASAVNGGDDGWLVSGDIQPEVQRALEEMQPGQLAGPIPTAEGVYILLLREKRTGDTMTLVNAKQALIRLPATASAEQAAAASASLSALRGKLHCCEGFDVQAAKVSGVSAGDTGEVSIMTLAPEFRTALLGMKPGEVTAPISTKFGVQIVDRKSVV